MTTPRPPSPSSPFPSSRRSRYTARTPTDLVAMVPVVLGFHPRDSVVLLTFGAPGGAFHARVDLALEVAAQEEVADVLLGAVTANRVEKAAVLMYSDDVEAARTQGEVLLSRLLGAGVDVVDVLRVEEGHWFPLFDDASPGTAYDLQTHRFTAQGVLDGHVVHRDRAELADSLVGGDDEDAVAVALAATRYADLLGSSAEDDLLVTEARWLQRFLRRALADRSVATSGDAGRALVLASLVPTRDVAWSEIDRTSAGEHVELWRGLVRRSPRHLLPGPCALLAFAAWQHGDGALAWCALDRCLEVDPDYSMGHALADLLTGAVRPDVWEPIPEEALPVFKRGRPQDRSPGHVRDHSRDGRPAPPSGQAS